MCGISEITATHTGSPGSGTPRTASGHVVGWHDGCPRGGDWEKVNVGSGQMNH